MGLKKSTTVVKKSDADGVELTPGQKAAATKKAKEAAASVAKAPAKAPSKAPAKAVAKVTSKPAADAPPAMTRSGIAEAIVAKVKATGKGVPLSIAEIMVGAYEEVIGEALASGREVSLPGFGKFLVQQKEAGTARNPATGESIEVAARTVTRFKVGTKLKKIVNGGAEVPEVEAEADAE